MTRSIRFLVLSSCCAVLTAAGCSQDDPDSGGNGSGTGGDGGADDGSGGDDGGTGTGGGTGDVPDDTNSKYYPTVDGATWSYLHTLADMTQWSEDVTMKAVQYDGRDAYLLTDSADLGGENTESTLAWKGTRILRVHKEVFAATQKVQIVDYDPGFPRFDNAWLTMAEGLVEPDTVYERTETDGLGNNPIVETRIQRYTVESLSTSVTVPAGTFDDCVAIRRERVEGTPRVKVFTFCADVGKVKEVNETTLTIEELVDYDVPGGGG